MAYTAPALLRATGALAVALTLAASQVLQPASARQAGPALHGTKPAVEASESTQYSPPVRDAGATNLYWGDTHLHTRDSADAFILGNETLTSDHAFQLAQGMEILLSEGRRVKLRRPLDFLAVTDHAEYLGVLPRVQGRDRGMLGWSIGRKWAEYLATGARKELIFDWVKSAVSSDPTLQQPSSTRHTIWKEAVKTADRYNRPGRFTAFIGYEWTSMIGGNMHRVVLFKDGGDKAAQKLPFSAQDSTDPEALWQALASYERDTGGQALAIPHNGNGSNGQMFAPIRQSGRPFDRPYAVMRSRWEPAYEVTQQKGDGETLPILSPNDEFADFERWDWTAGSTGPQPPGSEAYDYARSALKEGLQHDARLGANPFKFGMIGSTDSHNALSTTTEDNFWGKFPDSQPSQGRATTDMAFMGEQNWRLGASGLAAVWATENTREAIFAAFKRREIYATTGSRIQVRFFGGWDFDPTDVQRPDYAQIGYKKGVPMGGDLLRQARVKAPVFMIAAAKDPDEANLDRIQIIKGWVDGSGRAHEKIYDVALSDGRKISPKTGKASPVGSTVDLASASYTNSIGDPELTAVWRDPSFDPKARAFYYVRVLEIPKPRWTAYDARFFKLKMPAHVPMTVQDRAYTSPIWYQP